MKYKNLFILYNASCQMSIIKNHLCSLYFFRSWILSSRITVALVDSSRGSVKCKKKPQLPSCHLDLSCELEAVAFETTSKLDVTVVTVQK